MITGAILSLLGTVLHGVLSILPSVPSPPSWISSNTGALSTVLSGIGSMSVWFPLQLGITILLFVLSIHLVGFGIKVSRMVVSLFTGGGGSAA